MSTQQQQMAIGSSGSCSKAKPAIVQYNHDAKLTDAFDRSKESGSPFNYSREVELASGSGEPAEVPAYLNKIQRGGLVQPFGCLLCIVEPTFSILAYSENAHESLGPVSLGVDARTLFAPSSSASLGKAVDSDDLSLLNPIWVCSAVTEKHFYAILHRVDVGIVVDLEPAIAPGGDPGPSIAGAVQSQKLAARVISRLQSLPGGDIGALCGAIVENVRELTGYDRVMVYKFHEDEHGEVLAEIRRSDLDSYLGLHYPATDIPQATRFLFKQNRVRMICNCNAKPVRVIEDSKRLRNPLCLNNSTLRAPHGCHAEYMANMGSIASLVMAVVVNEKDSMRLWGLVVCHHTTVRYVPFPLRYACQFLMQAFALQLSMELQLAAQVSEKKTLQTQALLSDVLMREIAVTSIVTGSPNIMDLVKCNGAAMYHHQKFYLLGVTPTESQLADIVHWLLTFHQDSTGLSTESLAEAGYPNAASLGDQVCGMASVRINSKDFMFWFRSETAKEIKWGGAKHHPEVKDDGGRMHPRLSFHAFLEVKKTQSLPWEEAEMNAIHSLQLITRTSSENKVDPKGKGSSGILQQPVIKRMDELSSVSCEMVRLIETATVPVIAVDCAGLINGWNGKAAELTGLPANEAIGKSLVYELIHEDSREVVSQHLSRALQGYEDQGIELKLRTFDLRLKAAAVFIVANACCSKDYNKNIVGVCFLGQDMTEEKVVMDKFVRLQGDYKAIVQSLNPLIPPIFTSDENTCCSEWNAAMETLTGWRQEEVIGKLLIGEIFGSCCRLKDQDALPKIKILLYKASSGKNTENAYFGFHDKNGKYIETLLTVNTRTDMNGNIIGCIGFLHTTTPDLMRLFETQRQHERKWLVMLKELAYIRQEIRNPLSGLHFTHQLLEATDISDDQRQILETSSACEQQLMKILEDMDVERLENGYMELDIARFSLGEVISSVVIQVMPKVKEKNLKLLSDIPEEIKTMGVYGDQIRLQQVLADFFMNIVVHAPCSDSWVQLEVVPSSASSELDSVHLHLRMTHPGRGLPSELIEDMFDRRTECATHEGLVLNIASMLLKTMNGNVQYIREAEKCYFLVNIRFQKH